MALDDYFSNPSQDCLARLFDAINSMDLSAAPILTRHEKIVMRCSERKDVFAEKFVNPKGPNDQHNWSSSGLPPYKSQHRSTNSGESHTSFESGILIRNRDREPNTSQDRDSEQSHSHLRGRERAGTEINQSTSSLQHLGQPQSQYSPSDSSFNLGGSAVWVGDESGTETQVGTSNSSAASVGSSTVATTRGRRSTDTSSASSHLGAAVVTPPFDPQLRTNMAKDTHFYHTSIAYKEHHLPIKMPLSTFPEEVGDVRDYHPLTYESYV
jgi:hypothetical protein